MSGLTAEQAARAHGARIAAEYLGHRHLLAHPPVAGGFPQARVVMALGAAFASWILSGEIPLPEDGS